MHAQLNQVMMIILSESAFPFKHKIVVLDICNSMTSDLNIINRRVGMIGQPFYT